MIRLLAFLALMLAAQPAHAHKLKLFVTQDGAQIVGKVYFAGGGAAVDIAGIVTDGQGQVVATLRSDAEGRFRLTPGTALPLHIRFDSADGHMAEATLGDSAAPASAPASAGPDVEAAIARQLIPLREQLDRMETRARLSDIVGGVGLIAGLFGAYAWIAARREKKS